MVANEGHHVPFARGIASWSRERPRSGKVAFGGRIASNGFGGTAGGCCRSALNCWRVPCSARWLWQVKTVVLPLVPDVAGGPLKSLAGNGWLAAKGPSPADAKGGVCFDKLS